MAGAITRWEPFADFADLRGRFDRMLEELSEGRGRAWMPAVDVVREGDSLVLHADIPGIKPEEVKIEIENDVLTVSGSHEETKEEKEKQYVRRERRFGSFSRSMAIPPGVDAKKIKAETRNGVLEVRIPLPKKAEKETVEITPTAA